MSEPAVETSLVAPAAAEPAAVLFDMDGTLVDSEKLWTVALRDYAAFRGGELSTAAREAMVGSNMRESMRLVLVDLGQPADADEIRAAADWVEQRIGELFAGGLPWRPGAREALHAVRASGVPTALVTSTVRSLTELALHTLGRENFDVTVCGDEVNGRTKPDPEPYLRASRLLGVEPTECVAIEDSPPGVRAAAEAGCFVLAIPCEVPLEPGPTCVLRDSLHGVDMTMLRAYLTSYRAAAPTSCHN